MIRTRRRYTFCVRAPKRNVNQEKCNKLALNVYRGNTDYYV